MKTSIMFTVLAFSVNAFATPDYVDCKANESDKECVQRAVQASNAMTQNFYTGKKAERPGIFNAIYSHNPSTTILQITGEGGSIFTEYILVYPVDANKMSGLKAATFTAMLEKSVEDGPRKPKVVGRAVSISSIKILTGASEGTDE